MPDPAVNVLTVGPGFMARAAQDTQLLLMSLGTPASTS